MKKIAFLLYSLMLYPGVFLHAQDSLTSNISDRDLAANHAFAEIYLNSSEMSFIAPGGELGAPHKYVLSANIYPNFFVLGGHISRVAFSIIPSVRLRIRSNKNPGDKSLPVRTPSYNAGIKMYYRLNRNPQKFSYLSGSFFHHSNGQDGAALLNDGNYNTYNGNFTTNYLNFEYNFGTDKRKQIRFFGWRPFMKIVPLDAEIFEHYSIGMEIHPGFFANEAALDGNYGFTKVKFDWIKAWVINWDIQRGNRIVGNVADERIRTTLKFRYIINELDQHQFLDIKNRLIAEAAIHFAPPFTRNTSLMVAFGYTGEDEYNIYFEDRYWYLRLGISTGFLIYNTQFR